MLEKIMEDLSIEYTEVKERQLIRYMEEILERNRYINLTAITKRDEFIQKHYVDSLLCVASEEFQKSGSVIDVGTGGGFPGVPLAMCFPDKKFVLIDSLNKRIKIINELCETLGITNVQAIHGRAEELARRKDMRDTYDLCVSRAVANMSTLCEYCMPFVRVGGYFIAYKGPDCQQELDAAKKAIKELSGKLLRIETPKIESVPFVHKLIYIEKTNHTASKYPRKAGTPSKEPVS